MGILPPLLVIAAPFAGTLFARLAIALPDHKFPELTKPQCAACGTKLALADQIPILSFVLNKGKCRTCHAAIPLTFPLVEIGAVVVATTAAVFTSGWLLVVSCLFGWTMLILMATDLRAMILPNVITLPLIPLGLLVSVFLPGHQLIAHIIGAVAGGAILWFSAFLYERVRGRAGLGMGDVKLFAAAGAWLGWTLLPYVMLIASVAGLIGVILARLVGRQIGHQTPLPFGAALAPAIYVAWLFYTAPIA